MAGHTSFVATRPFKLRCRGFRRPSLICSASNGKSSVSKSRFPSKGMRILEAPYAFGYLIKTARFVWTTMWRLMMAELAPSSSTGAYTRPKSKFADGSERSYSENMVLFVGIACQWCHRILLARTLMGLERKLPLVVVEPGDDGLWKFKPEDIDTWGRTLKELYLNCDPDFRGRSTAPLLLDTSNSKIISNESSDILKILPKAFDAAFENPVPVPGYADTFVWLRPRENNSEGIDVKDLDDLCERIYKQINNGVYRCGFATSQQAYEDAINDLFQGLDEVERRLAVSRFLCSPTVITEADVRLFPTVFRFDAVYAVLFKASKKTIYADYPSISAWMTDIYNIPGVVSTCDLQATVQNYYTSLFPLNPGGIVPITRATNMSATEDRSQLGLVSSVAKET